MFFTQYFPLSSGHVPLTIPCYFCQCVQAQIPLDAQLGSGQPVPASINFLHTALLRQHYANHFRESLTWSYLQFSPPASAKDRQHFSLLAAAWIILLQLLTLNQRLATVLPSRSSAPLAIRPASAPVRTASTSSSKPSRPLRLVNYSALHVDTSYRTRVASPYRFLPYTSTCLRRGFFGLGKQLRSRSIHIPIYWPFTSRTFVYLHHVFSLS